MPYYQGTYRGPAEKPRPRGICAHCGRDITIRTDGLAWLHRDPETGHGCEGSHRPPLNGEARCLCWCHGGEQ